MIGAESPEQGYGLTATGTTNEVDSFSSGDGESHLDSFIDGSGWTRDDLLVVLTAAEVLLVLVLLYLEVSE
ncbi:hypothetical protein HSRCO_0279 [Halanaeroarchaeum sp. HSR-CO]|uniref:hypothetical protein n=1 Tax=Halanaeroarchaeum sp. HSR-CO TaxID=2866382 RepID=UPI00217CCADC|nr:hypothetical protein [Halanaeroarchaeum sp. HSR-CO]UWG46578.1 hypothetical protein HSRCO_0279 [Halanaeroarchaeum sp. HSR-CO]